MAKDPAILFYTSDFLTGTMFMTDSQVGKYMRLLCAQHQHNGFISKDSFNQIVGDDKILREKFKESENGFFNERLSEEMAKRKQKSNKMAANAKQKQSKSKAVVVPIESENESEIVNDSLKGLQGETFEENWKSAFDEIYLDQLRIKYGTLDIQTELNHFRFKCDSAPSEYHCRDRDGLRLGFLKQLSGESKKPSKQDGTLKIINDKLKSDALIKQKFAAKAAAGGGNAN